MRYTALTGIPMTRQTKRNKVAVSVFSDPEETVRQCGLFSALVMPLFISVTCELVYD